MRSVTQLSFLSAAIIACASPPFVEPDGASRLDAAARDAALDGATEPRSTDAGREDIGPLDASDATSTDAAEDSRPATQDVAVDSPRTDASGDDGGIMDARDAASSNGAGDAGDASARDVVSDAGGCASGRHLVGSTCVVDGGARLIAPLSLGDTTVLRPTLQFEWPDGADGAVVELCRDRECTSVIETLRVSERRARPSAPLPARSVVFWRARARVGAADDREPGPTWLFHTPAVHHPSAVDTSFNPHFDANGDGFDDVVVGAPLSDPSGRTDAGMVYISHGFAGGITATPQADLAGVNAGDRFGFTIANAGDLNGDGYADLAVSARFADPSGRSDAGTVSVFYGSPSGIRVDAARVFEGVEAGDYLGESLAGAGDVNLDGYADLLIGAPNSRPGGRAAAGAVTLVLGARSPLAMDASRVVQGERANDMLGLSLSGAGDLNGDGYSDVVLGAPMATRGALRETGLAWVFHGGSASIGAPTNTLQGVSGEYEHLGAGLSSGGDIDGDGDCELLVGRTGPRMAFDVRAHTNVYSGGATGIAVATPIVLASQQQNVRRANVGDVNGDGIADIVISSDSSPGRAGIGLHYGSATGIATASGQTISAPMEFNSRVIAVRVGDVNRDGFDDLLLGFGWATVDGLSARGAVTLYSGGAAGLSLTPIRQINGRTANEYFGFSVANLDERSAGWIVGRARRSLG